jgi:quercetin dioxygenase-like cupin family protein
MNSSIFSSPHHGEIDMRAHTNCSVLAGTALIWTSGAIAQGIPEQRLPAEKFNWPQSQANQAGSAMRPGLQTIFVLGDGTSKQLFSIVFRVPPNTNIPPHSHPDERSCFVLSGMRYFGYGTVRDEAQLQALSAGSSYTEPAGRIHFAGTKDVEAIAECTAMGPTGTTFFNPSDDPRNASK